MATVYIKDYDTDVEIPDDADMQQVQAALAKQFPPKNTSSIEGMTPEQLNSLPPYGADKITGMGTPGEVTAPMPEWKQNVMQYGVNPLPEYGEAAGTATGMGLALETGGPGVVAIPALAGAGRMLGTAVKTPLAKMLGFKEQQDITPGQVLSETARGATGGMLNAITGQVGTNLATKMTGKSPSQALDALLTPKPTGQNALQKSAEKGAKYLTRRIVRPSAESDPFENKNVINSVLKHDISLPSGKAPEQIANKINTWSRQLDEDILAAQNAGGTVPKTTVLEPVQQLLEKYGAGDVPRDIGVIHKYLDGFNKLHPENELSPVDAQELKKFIYERISENQFGNAMPTAIAGARKGVARGLKTGLEDVVPSAEGLNRNIGDLIQARPAINTATNRIQNAPLRSRTGEHLKHGLSRVLYGASKAEPAAGKTAEEISHIGSPIQSLEDMFNVKYGPPKSSPPLQLPNRGPGTMYGTQPETQKMLPGTNKPQLTSGPVEEMVSNGGGKYIGTTPPEGKTPSLVWFNDPETGSTLAMKADSVNSPESVATHMAKSREAFLKKTLK